MRDEIEKGMEVAVVIGHDVIRATVLDLNVKCDRTLPDGSKEEFLGTKVQYTDPTTGNTVEKTLFRVLMKWEVWEGRSNSDTVATRPTPKSPAKIAILEFSGGNKVELGDSLDVVGNKIRMCSSDWVSLTDSEGESVLVNISEIAMIRSRTIGDPQKTKLRRKYTKGKADDKQE